MNQRTFEFTGPVGGSIIVPQMNVEFAVIEWDGATESWRITFHLVSGKTVGTVGFTEGETRDVISFLEGRRFAR